MNKEKLEKTEDELIFIDRETPLTDEMLKNKLEALKEAVREGDEEKMKKVLIAEVPTFMESGEKE